MRVLAILSLLTTLATIGSTVQAQVRDPAAAQLLFAEGRAAAKAGDWPKAYRMFADSQRLDPAPGTLVNLAVCEENIGKIATAWQHFHEVMDQLPASDDRAQLAKTHADALEPRLPRLTLVFEGDVPPQTRVVRDGVEISPTMLGMALPVDPGEHVVEVLSPGFETATVRVAVRESESRRLPIAMGARKAAPAATPGTALPGADTGSPADGRVGLSHAGRLGFVVRLDVDGKGRGALVAPGVTFGVGNHFELLAGGLIGSDQGAYGGAVGYLLEGPWKLMVGLDVPMILTEGTHVGVHGFGGLQWDASPSFGAFAALGVTHFFSVPDNFEKTVFVPSIGAQTRL